VSRRIPGRRGRFQRFATATGERAPIVIVIEWLWLPPMCTVLAAVAKWVPTRRLRQPHPG